MFLNDKLGAVHNITLSVFGLGLDLYVINFK